MRFLLLLASLSASAQEIPQGTHLLLRMEHSISSRTANVGDGVHLRTVVPLIAGGKVLVPVGSFAQGVVTQVKRCRKGHKNAELQIQLTSLISPSNEVLTIAPLTTSVESGEPASRGRSERDPLLPGGQIGVLSGGSVFTGALAGGLIGGRTGAAIGVGAGVGAILLPIILAHGHEVELRQGAAVDVVFRNPTRLD